MGKSLDRGGAWSGEISSKVLGKKGVADQYFEQSPGESLAWNKQTRIKKNQIATPLDASMKYPGQSRMIVVIVN